MDQVSREQEILNQIIWAIKASGQPVNLKDFQMVDYKHLTDEEKLKSLAIAISTFKSMLPSHILSKIKEPGCSPPVSAPNMPH